MNNENDILNKTGFTEENELLELIENNDDHNGAAATWAFTTLPCLGGIVVATLTLGACPTSACTKSCNR